ncbi:MAG: hypothetical protein A2X61_16335 [Ignavibacteria bacterium GWB2_35_12]|nr:MAG: hypothetical protein A2X63_13255 [Ignavibacteria bacterium GWA2_35_8]OGU39967.1 MAG: hypothetical protein A2X61_16335 [Ignavibacteria bacterium GWB2_35_12]OGU86276.1 MAG: hypothetical protein A2220_10220 [Ignavibacteria bacterium RIFOXYA2_FULL_35_10]OGV21855.1 MAG: hypothetical protein A2475_11145 [Ignavibacteria bacterium RIFOXYC2_FULL_35_21]
MESQRRFLNTFGETDAAIDIRMKYNEEITKAPENLGNKVNSLYSEYAPVIAPDGETLYFVRRDNPGGFGGEDIYYSELDANGDWGEAQNIGSPLNNEGHNAVSSISPDGNLMILHNLYNDLYTGNGNSISYRLSEGWSYPNDIDMKNFISLSTYHNSTMSNDGKVIIISAKRYDSYGGNDIYISFKNKDDSWSEPRNLGTTINTWDEESSPFLASDNVTLYFSSKGHSGFGGSDLFLTRRLDKSWKKWSTPENLGPTINSYGDEGFYVIPASGDFAYFASSKDSYGGQDIYRIGLPMDKRPNPVILIEGKVINAKTNEPVEAEIHYEDLITGEELGIAHTNPSTGIYKIILPAGKKYGFRAEAPDFISVNDNVDLMNLKVYKKSVSDLQLVPIEKGQKARINNLFFDFGKSKLRKEPFPELNRLVQILKDNPNIKLEVSGHTDNIGTDAVNMKLSDARAKSVVNYLVSKGISKSKVIAKGYGPTKPVAPNDSEDNRQKNRRVEILII